MTKDCGRCLDDWQRFTALLLSGASPRPHHQGASDVCSALHSHYTYSTLHYIYWLLYTYSAPHYFYWLLYIYCSLNLLHCARSTAQCREQ